MGCQDFPARRLLLSKARTAPQVRLCGWLAVPNTIWLPSSEFKSFMAIHKQIRANRRNALKHALRAALLPGQDKPDPQPNEPKLTVGHASA